ncbi:MAG: hypothetical protein AB7F98_17770 [Novosphingobium sp.]
MSTSTDNGTTSRSPEGHSNPGPPEIGDHLSDQADGETSNKDAEGDGYEVKRTWENTYRDEDWEEGPPRIRPHSEEPAPHRRFDLKHASPDEIAVAQAEMLNELTCEAHAFALDYFATASGIC